MLHDQKSWYRVFYIFGLVLPCWWYDETHVFKTITESHMTDYGLRSLVTITKKIWDVCRLDLFSTEIVVTQDRKFVVMDYVNEICDMRQRGGRDLSPHRAASQNLIQLICIPGIQNHKRLTLQAWFDTLGALLEELTTPKVNCY